MTASQPNGAASVTANGAAGDVSMGADTENKGADVTMASSEPNGIPTGTLTNGQTAADTEMKVDGA